LIYKKHFLKWSAYAKGVQIKNGKICVSGKEGAGVLLWAQNIFFAHFHQYDVRADLADSVPWNDILLIRTEDSAQTERPRNDKGGNASFFIIQYQITYFSKPPAVAAVDHILFFQFAKTHPVPPYPFYIIMPEKRYCSHREAGV